MKYEWTREYDKDLCHEVDVAVIESDSLDVRLRVWMVGGLFGKTIAHCYVLWETSVLNEHRSLMTHGMVEGSDDARRGMDAAEQAAEDLLSLHETWKALRASRKGT